MLTISTDWSDNNEASSFDDVERELLAMTGREEGFLILSRSDEDYVQLARTPSGFRIERRSGSAVTHQIASSTICGARYCDEFDQRDVERVLRAYFNRQSDAEAGLLWEELNLQDVFPIYGLVAIITALVLIAAAVYFAVH